MPELFEGIVATRTVCAEGSLDLVSGRPDLGDKNKAALGSQGMLSHYSFYRAGASRQSTALMLKTRARWMLKARKKWNLLLRTKRQFVGRRGTKS